MDNNKITDAQLSAFDAIYEKYVTLYSQHPLITEAIDKLNGVLKPNSNILDIGCGAATPTAARFVNANHHYTGVDSSGKMLQLAKEHCKEAKFIQLDFTKLEWKEEYDAVLAFFSLLMLPKKMILSMVDSISSHLKKDGFFLLSMIKGDLDYVEIPFLGKPVRVSAYQTEELKKIIESRHLKIVEMKEYEYTPGNNLPSESNQFFYCQKI